MTTMPQLPPPPDIDRLAFRRSLLDASESDAALSELGRFLAPRLAAVAAFLNYYPGVYRQLLTQRQSVGSDPELEREALAMAADIATVMQSLRSRPEVVQGLIAADGHPNPPLIELDQLFSALVLISGDSGLAVPDDLLLTEQDLDDLFKRPAVQNFNAYVENGDS